MPVPTVVLQEASGDLLGVPFYVMEKVPGHVIRAARALDAALSLGYRDFKWLARDPDLRTLRQHPLYRDIEEKIRKMKGKRKVKVT